MIVSNVFSVVSTTNAQLTVLMPGIVTLKDGVGFQDGQFGFNLIGTNGQKLVVQTSTNLQNWTTIQTNIMSNAISRFNAPQSTGDSSRFYRAIIIP
jgi:hypothetical protein